MKMKKIILILIFATLLVYGFLVTNKEKDNLVVSFENIQVEENINKNEFKQILVDVATESAGLLIEDEYEEDESVYDKEFDTCSDMIIDQVTEMAFGQHGIPYTGEVTCYRDKEKQILKSKQFYTDGVPVGRHICYTDDGVPLDSISYDNTSRKESGYNATYYREKYGGDIGFGLGFDECVSADLSVCWRDRKCTEGADNCMFRCE